MKMINIAKDFSDTPGARYRTDGDFSGQEFREEFLEPLFVDNTCKEATIILDGTYGYPTSFLEEAFGGLARLHGKQNVKSKLNFISVKEPLLIKEIQTYIDAQD